MGENAGRLDVLTRGRQSTAFARQGDVPGQVLDLEQAFLAAEKIAKSGLVGRELQNAAAVVRVGLKGQAMGIDFFEAVDVIDVIDKKPVPNAQCRLGHIRSRGHEAQFVAEECDREKATIRGRRREHRNDPKGWVTVVYTIDDAEEGGLLDEWVERKYKLQGDQYDRTQKFMLRRTETGYVPAQLGAELPEWAAKAIRDGMVKRKDNWWKNRKAMLRARAASTLYRMHFSDLMFAAGVEPYTAEELGRDQGSDVDDYPDPDDEQVYDGEIVIDQGEEPGRIGHATAAPPGPAPDPEKWAAFVRWTEAGEPRDENGYPVDIPPATEAPERGRDNAAAEVVEPQTAPAASGPVPGEWRARAVELGKGDALVLKKARDFATERGVEVADLPRTLDQITDPADIARLEEWLG